VIGVPLAGAEVDQLLLAALGLASVALMLLVARRWPLVLAVGYLATTCFVPIWTGVSAGIYFPPQVLMAVLVLAVAVPQLRRLGVGPTRVDLLVLAFGVVSIAPLAVGGASLTSVASVVTKFLAAYLVGRLLPALVGWGRFLTVLVWVFAVLAVLTLAENLTGTNLFQSFPGSPGLHAQWDDIQIRGGVARAEGAFGHSIALGATLASSVPLILAASIRPWLRVVTVVLVLSAVVVTFSRIGLVTACLGLLVSLVLGRGLPARLRAGLAAGAAVVALIAVPLLGGVFTAAGDEAAGSAAYRGDLVSLIGDIDALGFSSAFARTADGSPSFGQFESIDSALILHGLTYGWLSLGIVAVLLVVAVVAVLARRASAATIAVAAQVPALATVALITQYATWIWFLAGLAVWAQAAGVWRSRAPVPEGPPSLPPSGERASLTRAIAG
jgi:hypothetical protein